jgi:hypothetical protein
LKQAVALFSYNRPEKTGMVLDALQAQDIGNLYLFCDGPKSEADRDKVHETRRVVQEFSYPRKKIRVSTVNRGLASSIIQGVSEAFEYEENLIILEDDCVPLKNMIRFMATCLSLWKGNTDVFSVSAHHFIRDQAVLKAHPYDVFFSNRFLCWGWGTWRDRWIGIIGDLKKRCNPYGSFKAVPLDAGPDLPFHAYCHETKSVDSWAIPLAMIVLKRGYVHAMPRYPLVFNTGMDGSGTHCGVDNAYANRAVTDGLPLNFTIPETVGLEQSPVTRAFYESMIQPPEWFQLV